VNKPTCKCGHAYSMHDTGWDASGCMASQCSCRAYFPPNALKEPTARELSHRVRQGYDEADALLLVARVEAVLALHNDSRMGATDCEHCHNLRPCPTVRILNGESE
jgi:hypothetical protein